jgi:hypothetical protein
VEYRFKNNNNDKDMNINRGLLGGQQKERGGPVRVVGSKYD